MFGITLAWADVSSHRPPMTLTKSISPRSAWRTAISRLLVASCRPRASRRPTCGCPRCSPAPTGVADLLEHLQREAHAVFEAAAVGVGAAVHGGRPELVRQVAGEQTSRARPGRLPWRARGGRAVRAMDAAMSVVSISLGKERAGWLAHGRGETGGSQSPVSQRVRRPYG